MKRDQLMTLWVFLFPLLLLNSCGRKDVNRNGELKMRGEKPIRLAGKKPGSKLQKGIASWYGHPFHGRRTANGETYNMHGKTAAHKSLPFGTHIRVVNRRNDREVIVRINDRGPFKKGRIIDLSRGAAEAIGLIGTGTAEVVLYLHDGRSQETRRHTSPVNVSDEWTVQVGSFRELDRARTMIYRLDEYPHETRISRFNGLYRVRIGQFSSKQKASSLCGKLKRDGIDCFVTAME